MPVNLNALIRYKTLDRCFRETSAVATIDYLIEKCSEVVREATGHNSGVSERTIRNDIRILRSDILGFNAPIVINGGVYSYSDSNYFLFNSTCSEIDLLKEIQQLLIDEFDNISSKNLPYLLKSISSITKVEVAKELLPEPPKENKHPYIFEKRIQNYYVIELSRYLRNQRGETSFGKKPKPLNIAWDFIFDVL